LIPEVEEMKELARSETMRPIEDSELAPEFKRPQFELCGSNLPEIL
jgi:hypothetical protein